MVELLTGIIAVFLLKRFDVTLDFLGYFVFVVGLIAVSGVDLTHRIIPDRISLPGIGAGVVFSLVNSRVSLLDSVVGIGVGAGSLLAVTVGYAGFVRLRERIKGVGHQEETEEALKGLSLTELKKEAALYGVDGENLRTREEIVKAIGEAKREGMGGGDVKLLAMIGAFLGGWKPILFVILVGSFLGCLVGIPLMLSKGRDSKYAIPFGPFLAAGAIIYLLWGMNTLAWYLRLGR
jgi:leader peptidase (prepilin peptidase)/N-methyltransferase